MIRLTRQLRQAVLAATGALGLLTLAPAQVFGQG